MSPRLGIEWILCTCRPWSVECKGQHYQESERTPPPGTEGSCADVKWQSRSLSVVSEGRLAMDQTGRSACRHLSLPQVRRSLCLVWLALCATFPSVGLEALALSRLQVGPYLRAHLSRAS